MSPNISRCCAFIITSVVCCQKWLDPSVGKCLFPHIHLHHTARGEENGGTNLAFEKTGDDWGTVYDLTICLTHLDLLAIPRILMVIVISCIAFRLAGCLARSMVFVERLKGILGTHLHCLAFKHSAPFSIQHKISPNQGIHQSTVNQVSRNPRKSHEIPSSIRANFLPKPISPSHHLG